MISRKEEKDVGPVLTHRAAVYLSISAQRNTLFTRSSNFPFFFHKFLFFFYCFLFWRQEASSHTESLVGGSFGECYIFRYSRATIAKKRRPLHVFRHI